MKEVKQFSEYQSLIENKETFILYAHAQACGVCHVFMPKLEELAEIYQIPRYGTLIDHLPEVRGQLSIYTVPALILYFEGKEFHRQARFLDLGEVERRLGEISARTS